MKKNEWQWKSFIAKVVQGETCDQYNTYSIICLGANKITNNSGISTLTIGAEVILMCPKFFSTVTLERVSRSRVHWAGWGNLGEKDIYTYTCILSFLLYRYIIVELSPNSSHMYDHGFMDNTNRQAVCKSHKESFEWFTNSRRITLKTIKTHHNQSKGPVTI